MTTTPIRKPRKGAPRKASSEAVKAAAARAEARSAGEDVVEPKAPITPVIVTAEAIAAEKAAARSKIKRRRRRTSYSPPLGKAICKMLGRGLTLTAVCKRPLMPREDTVLDWAISPDHSFSRLYARAREVGYIRMGDQIIDIADDSDRDYMPKLGKDGAIERVVNRELLERAKIRIDARKWLLSKALPKVFGDKVAMEHTGKDGGPIESTSRPQPTGDDHLADLTKRYAPKVPAVNVPAPIARTRNGAGLH